MRIALASDHAALELKAELREYLIGLGHEVAAAIADGTAERGVALCGSGSGISMTP